MAALRTLSLLHFPTSTTSASASFSGAAVSSSSYLSSSSSLLLPSSYAKPYRFRLTSSLLGDAVRVSPVFPPPAPWSTLRTTTTSVVLSLPSSKLESSATEKIPKWSARAIKSFAMAELEARKLKYPNTGTEALLMGILVEGTNEAAKFLRANGITLFKVREETVKLLGKSDMYFFSPEHPPLTEPAQRAIDWAINEKLKSGADGEVTTIQMLLGIWSEKESAGHKILAFLGFDDEKANELAKSANDDVIMKYR